MTDEKALNHFHSIIKPQSGWTFSFNSLYEHLDSRTYRMKTFYSNVLREVKMYDPLHALSLSFLQISPHTDVD